MNTLSPKTIRWIGLGAVLLIGAAILLSRQQNNGLHTALRGSRFEDYYTSTIDSLHTHTQAVYDKLQGNMPGNLKILPENFLRRAKTGNVKRQGEATLNDITLRGIYWSDTMPLAEINDQLCKAGDEIAGFTLQEIQPYQVLLLDAAGVTNIVSLIKGNFNTEPTK